MARMSLLSRIGPASIANPYSRTMLKDIDDLMVWRKSLFKEKSSLSITSPLDRISYFMMRPCINLLSEDYGV